jgi:hypothetical protein
VVALPDSIAAESFSYPQILPDGKTALVVRAIPQGAARVVAVTLATGDTTTVLDGATRGLYVHASGARGGDRLLYSRPDGTVMLAPFDLRHLRISEPSILVANAARGASTIAVALDGTFAFQPSVLQPRELVIREADGASTVLPVGIGQYRSPRFSPDGGQIAVAIHVDGVDARSDIWTYDVARGLLSKLTFDGGSTYPEYSPDGRWISYASLVRPNDRDLLRVPAGGGTPETVLAAPGQQHEGIVTPDGTTLVYREINARTGFDIWAVDLTRPVSERLRGRRQLAATSYGERGIALSPDGRWLAFTSDASKRNEIYVRPLADTPERSQVSPGGGDEAQWDPAGRALYYWNGDTLFSVAVERAPAFHLGARRARFVGRFLHDARASYDVSPDGQRILLVRELDSDRPSEITVVLHALDGHRQTLPR